MADTDSTRRAHSFKDLTGCTFGRVTVICFNEFIERTYPSRARARRIPTWSCRCECGNEFVARTSYLTGKNGRGCHSCKSVSHGLSHTKEHAIWRSMIRRCHNPDDSGYADYGGRGIAVCELWRTSFEAFIKDMGPRPSVKHTVDRTDNDGCYCPENCRWATRSEQQKNTRRNVLLAFNGETHCLSEWAELVGIHRSTLQYRMRLGWTAEQVLTAPLRR